MMEGNSWSSGWSSSFQALAAWRSASFWRAMRSAWRTASAMKRLRPRYSTRRSRSARISSGSVMWVRDALMGSYCSFRLRLQCTPPRPSVKPSVKPTAGEINGHWQCVAHSLIRDGWAKSVICRCRTHTINDGLVIFAAASPIPHPQLQRWAAAQELAPGPTSASSSGVRWVPS